LRLTKLDFDAGYRRLLTAYDRKYLADQADEFYRQMSWRLDDAGHWNAVVTMAIGNEVHFPRVATLGTMASQLKQKQRQVAPLQAPENDAFLPVCTLCRQSPAFQKFVRDDGSTYERCDTWHTDARCARFNGSRKLYEEAAAIEDPHTRVDYPVTLDKQELPASPSLPLISNESDDIWVAGDAYEGP